MWAGLLWSAISLARPSAQQADCHGLRDRLHTGLMHATDTVYCSTHTHTHPFNGPFSWTTRVGRYQKGKTNQDFTEARDSEWQWHQLDHMQVCTLLQTDNHTSTPPLSFLQAGCPSCRPTNSVKALKANTYIHTYIHIYIYISGSIDR